LILILEGNEYKKLNTTKAGRATKPGSGRTQQCVRVLIFKSSLLITSTPALHLEREG